MQRGIQKKNTTDKPNWNSKSVRELHKEAG